MHLHEVLKIEIYIFSTCISYDNYNKNNNHIVCLSIYSTIHVVMLLQLLLVTQVMHTPASLFSLGICQLETSE